ncbi:MAG TPA: hypothetical protein PLQ03_03910 [Brevundimonas sp.]|uniref:hypothetical protein n=1 Tax=Brevundimonas sp. TaxID=1871086 RepID=UPI0026250B0C|nr:hypothetical protein [Brevundimonas sp.]HRO32537.1 hypothetical protein [Brevundimonas sp.]
MTDAKPAATADQLVSLTTFEKAAIWLPRMALEHLRQGLTFIEGKTFTDCTLEGPAVVLMGDGVAMDGCHMGVASDPSMLLLRPVGTTVNGVIGFKNCKFIRCRFAQVGFVGDDRFIAEFQQNAANGRPAKGDQ